jgi:hypothetical protein
MQQTAIVLTFFIIFFTIISVLLIMIYLVDNHR